MLFDRLTACIRIILFCLSVGECDDILVPVLTGHSFTVTLRAFCCHHSPQVAVRQILPLVIPITAFIEDKRFAAGFVIPVKLYFHFFGTLACSILFVLPDNADCYINIPDEEPPPAPPEPSPDGSLEMST